MARVEVKVKPEMIRWALERAARRAEDLHERFPKLAAWEEGLACPTLKQLEDFAKAARVPIGYLFLNTPPEERVPIPDLRTMAMRGVGRPSPDLLDVIYLCQGRQEWYRDYARITGELARRFVGSVTLRDSVETVAGRMRYELGLDMEERQRIPTWTDALRRFVEQADELGVLVMISSVVGANNRRKLDPEEFRGFALCDEIAPLVFINGTDTKAAQMFTLAHELAHLWLGESALSDVGPVTLPTSAIEEWCNRVAAELLVPLDSLRAEYRTDADLQGELNRLARHYKVSTLVVLRRIYDAGALSRDELWNNYERELERLRHMAEVSGGDFYLSQTARAGTRFARALITSTFEGHTSFTEAFRLLGVKKVETLYRFGHELGIVF
jgi:Zn-dependent peptidase ImmA (M78 family)